MNLLLVDTGPLVALASKRDHAHASCTAFLKAYKGRLLTTWAVLTEFSHLVPSVAATLPLYHWIERGGLELLPLGRDELVSTIDWIERYADRPMDLADASLVVAALKTGCSNVWTLDRSDFETYRLPGRKHFKLV
ncbi:type II toxin-antitoxin system VapC family toxin [Azovibrio restrictus]|uniref:type II toxin-antitoxin system VapC family toxin n=1 Tax=Azovibrio TaxID=146935 RepID=UPI0026ECAAAC|nr:PIN domain-containing protein [Azovibrio restrictus]MDD3482699.1 PIN domain-containing protein [Azovibrio restrictus]